MQFSDIAQAARIAGTHHDPRQDNFACVDLVRPGHASRPRVGCNGSIAGGHRLGGRHGEDQGHDRRNHRHRDGRIRRRLGGRVQAPHPANAGGRETLGVRIGTANGGDTTSSTTSAAQGGTYRLVGKLSKTAGGNYNRVDLFINPTTATEPATPDATDTADSGVAALSVFGVRTFNFDDGDRYQFDDVTVGTTFADVAGVPEPTTLALLALPALTRRRH